MLPSGYCVGYSRFPADNERQYKNLFGISRNFILFQQAFFGIYI